MEKMNLPDASILVTEIKKANGKAPGKSVKVLLGKDVDLPTGGGGAIVGKGAPTLKTEADEGQTYLDSDTGDYYLMFKDSNGVYSWVQIDTDPTIEKWATIHYYSEFSESYTSEWGDNCTVHSVDKEKLESFLAEHEAYPDDINFDYQELWNPETGEPTGECAWVFHGMGDEVAIAPEDMLTTTGIDVTLDDPEMPWAMFNLIKSVEANTESEVKTVDVLSKKQWESLGGGSRFWTASGLGKNEDVEIPNVAICYIQYDEGIGEFPNYFAAWCSNLKSVEPFGEPLQDGYAQIYFEKIGQRFLAYCPLFISVSLNPLVEEVSIDYGCLAESGNENSTGVEVAYGTPDGSRGARLALGMEFCSNSNFYNVTVRPEISSLGDSFCAGMSRLTEVSLGYLVCPNIGNSFCANCSNLQHVWWSASSTLTSISSMFLYGCQSLQDPTFLNAIKSVTSVESGFMAGCTALNDNSGYLKKFCQGLRSIGREFLSRCPNLYGEINITAASIDPVYFMFNTNYTTIRLPDVVTRGQYDYDRAYFLSTDNSSSVAYQMGRTIVSLVADDWCAAYPNKDTSPYRKLIPQPIGGGGGGTQYGFADTPTGWEVNGSDGSHFEHTDMGGGSSINVVQTTGQSTTDVMSQKAVTDIIGDIENILHIINNGEES